MSTTWTFEWHNEVDGVLTALAAAPKLSDSGAAYGIRRTASPNTIIVSDGKDMTASATAGIYTYTITVDDSETAADGATDGTAARHVGYTAYIEYVDDGETYHDPVTFTVGGAAAPTRGTAAWACDEVEAYTGNATAGNALKHVQAGTERFLRGTTPDSPNTVHVWSFLPTYKEITLAASDEDTCTGDFTGTALALTTTNAFFSATVNGSAGRYVEIEDVGIYRVASNSSTTAGVLTAETSQYTTDFATAKNCWFAPIVDLPTEFAGMVFDSVMHVYSDTYGNYALKATTPEHLMRLWRDDNDDDDGVLWYALVPKPASFGTAAQAWQLWWHPRQTYTRIVRCRYHIDATLLTDSSSVYLPGGSAHWETILAAALANAEWMKERKRGPAEQIFREMMMQSIAVDRTLFESERVESLADADTGISWE